MKTHVSRILGKLALRDRVQLVVYAYEHGCSDGTSCDVAKTPLAADVRHPVALLASRHGIPRLRRLLPFGQQVYGHGAGAVQALDDVTVVVPRAASPPSWALPARASRRS